MKLLKRPKPSQRRKIIGGRLAKDGTSKPIYEKPKVTFSKKPPLSAKAIKEAAAAKQAKIDANEAARRRYAEERGLPERNARDNLAHLDQYAKVQVVTYPNGKVKEIPVIVPTALGEALETTGVTITRWLKSNMLPEPALLTSRGGGAYHLEEARSFIRIIGEHQQHFRQYRKNHTTVTEKLFRENTLLRSNLFNVR